MPQKQKTQAEVALAQYHFADDVLHSSAVAAVDTAIAEIRVSLSLTKTEAHVALRDYAQYLLAVLGDEKAAAAKARNAELSAQLDANRAAYREGL